MVLLRSETLVQHRYKAPAGNPCRAFACPLQGWYNRAHASPGVFKMDASHRRTGIGRLTPLLWGLLFGLAYSQAPLYTSNQNQYFLHGAAAAGVGLLREDWLANTLDPTPLFSLLVRLTFRFLPPAAFYLYALLLLGLYLYSLAGIAAEAFPETRRGTGRLLLLTGLTLTHAALLRAALSRGLGPRWDYLLDGGVAGQRLLGPVLQPSTFGVLLLFSILLFMRRRLYAAVLAAALAASFHPTYLLGAATLVLTYAALTLSEQRRLREPLLIGFSALVLVLPITAYTWMLFRPTSPAVAAQAREILTTLRIPHHALIPEWLDLTVGFKVVWALGALALAWRSRRLRVILSTLIAVALLLTLIQATTGSQALALIFPWRLSTLLVPLATALWCAGAAARLRRRASILALQRILPYLCGALALALTLTGTTAFALELKRKQSDPARPLMSYVFAHKAPRQLYLIPLRMQDFRMATGAPVLADFKAIPYKDVEVLEWYRRQRMAGWFFRDRIEYVDCGLLPRFAQEYDVTHVVLPAHLFELTCPGLEPLFQDDAYGLYLLREP